MKDQAIALAEAVRANIKACYASTEAGFRLDHCKSAPWTEEAYRLKSAADVAAAATGTTHLAVIDALDAFDRKLATNKLVESLHAASEAHASARGASELELAALNALLKEGFARVVTDEPKEG